jgi:hypothetical protein
MAANLCRGTRTYRKAGQRMMRGRFVCLFVAALFASINIARALAAANYEGTSQDVVTGERQAPGVV